MGEATSPTPRDPVPSPARDTADPPDPARARARLAPADLPDPARARATTTPPLREERARDTADPPDLARARVTAPRLAQVVPLPVALLDLAAAAADPRVRAREVPPTAAADPRVRARAHLAPVAPRRPARARAHLAPAVPTTLARPVLRSKQMKRSI